jgi:TRAP-type C4-dicarboxylate transport system permease small subunit
MKKPFRDEPERLFFAWCVVRGASCVVRGAQHFGAYADTA